MTKPGTAFGTFFIQVKLRFHFLAADCTFFQRHKRTPFLEWYVLHILCNYPWKNPYRSCYPYQVTVRVSLSLTIVEDEISAWLFERFSFFYITDSSILERNNNFPAKTFRNDIQFEKCIANSLLPDWVRHPNISNRLSPSHHKSPFSFLTIGIDIYLIGVN